MISPGMSCCEHTLNTLRYADRLVWMMGPPREGEFSPYFSGVKKAVLVPLRFFRLKRCTGGSFTVSFRVLNLNNMTGDSPLQKREGTGASFV